MQHRTKHGKESQALSPALFKKCLAHCIITGVCLLEWRKLTQDWRIIFEGKPPNKSTIQADLQATVAKVSTHNICTTDSHFAQHMQPHCEKAASQSVWSSCGMNTLKAPSNGSEDNVGPERNGRSFPPRRAAKLPVGLRTKRADLIQSCGKTPDCS